MANRSLRIVLAVTASTFALAACRPDGDSPTTHYFTDGTVTTHFSDTSSPTLTEEKDGFVSASCAAGYRLEKQSSPQDTERFSCIPNPSPTK